MKNLGRWSDGTKYKFFGSDAKQYVRRSVGTRHHFKYQKLTVKHGGTNIMVWGCFLAYCRQNVDEDILCKPL